MHRRFVVQVSFEPGDVEAKFRCKSLQLLVRQVPLICEEQVVHLAERALQVRRLRRLDRPSSSGIDVHDRQVAPDDADS